MEYLLLLFIIIFIIAPWLPQIPGSRAWYLNVWQYGRIQLFFASIFLTGLYDLVSDSPIVSPWIILLVILISNYQLPHRILPFTTLVQKSLKDIVNPSNSDFKMMVYNLYQYNDQYKNVIELISYADPDVLLLVEPNKTWTDQINEAIGNAYEYKILAPQEDTYGICLYSKLEIRDSEIQYLIDEQFPSIWTTVILKSGQEIKLIGIHPPPPAPGESPTDLPKIKEIIKTAVELQDLDLPCLVTGDLNDVAWGSVSRRFKKITGLKDFRVGRGFFNTFPAQWPGWRIPIDQVFCSQHFEIGSINRLPACGSDHFPIMITLACRPKINKT